MTETSNELRARVYDIIGRLCPLGERVVLPTDRIVDDLGYHSVKVVELTVELETQLDLEQINDDEVAGLATAGDLADLIVSTNSSSSAL